MPQHGILYGGHLVMANPENSVIRIVPKARLDEKAVKVQGKPLKARSKRDLKEHLQRIGIDDGTIQKTLDHFMVRAKNAGQDRRELHEERPRPTPKQLGVNNPKGEIESLIRRLKQVASGEAEGLVDELDIMLDDVLGSSRKRQDPADYGGRVERVTEAASDPVGLFVRTLERDMREIVDADPSLGTDATTLAALARLVMRTENDTGVKRAMSKIKKSGTWNRLGKW